MQTIKTQFSEMLTRGIMPVFELEIVNDDYLLISLSINDKGVVFSFDTMELPVSFDGEIEILSDIVFMLPFDNCFDHLDHYLEMISDNINEGFILPNNLYVNEDQL